LESLVNLNLSLHQLPLERPDVGEGIVGVIEGLARVALVGFSEPVAVDVALDFEDVEEAGAFFREINADPGKFFHQHGHVEVVGSVEQRAAVVLEKSPKLFTKIIVQSVRQASVLCCVWSSALNVNRKNMKT